jgi:hypothetical protein
VFIIFILFSFIFRFVIIRSFPLFKFIKLTRRSEYYYLVIINFIFKFVSNIIITITQNYQNCIITLDFSFLVWIFVFYILYTIHLFYLVLLLIHQFLSLFHQIIFIAFCFYLLIYQIVFETLSIHIQYLNQNHFSFA